MWNVKIHIYRKEMRRYIFIDEKKKWRGELKIDSLTCSVKEITNTNNKRSLEGIG